MTLSGADVDQVAEALIREKVVPAGPPDGKDAGWLAATQQQRIVRALWDDALSVLGLDRKAPTYVQAQNGAYPLHDPETLMLLGRIPFELATIGSTYREWGGAVPYAAPTFSDGHISLGWACGFRGAGHNRLVSRRWLEHGPWRTIRVEEQDLTWVVFHDLMAPPDEALLQAQDGWDRIADVNEGGFIHSGYGFSEDLSGVHDPTTGRFKVIVARGPVKSRKMLDMAVARRNPRVQAQTPFDKVTFVYLTEEEALADLPRLWRYEHECWAIVDGEQVQLGAGYRPEDETPQWARRS